MKHFNKIFLFLILFILIIPISFASDNITMDNDNLAVGADDTLLSASDIYFDSSVEIDGNGTQTSPYKYLYSSRLTSNSVAHFADGEYQLDRTKDLNNLTIIGQSPLSTIIKSSSLKLTTQTTLNIINITLNDVSINNRGNFMANNVIFENSDGSYTGGYSNVFGGIVYSNGGTTLIYSSTFKNNTATYGGAIYATNSKVKVADSIFEDNYAYKYGGAIASEDNSQLFVENSAFTNCYTLTNAGGAIYSKGSQLTVNKSNFTSCNATFGGAICDLASNSDVNSIIAINNEANYQGGAIYKMYGSMNVTSSTFTSNNALSGGAIFADNSSYFSVKSSKFDSNEATYDGGAIYTILNTKNVISSNTYKNNKAKNEKDYYNASSYDLSIGNGNYTLFKGDFSFNGSLPSQYDLRDYGWVTPVKNQKGSGNCWAFTSLAALESCILKATGITYDLSEENMKNVMAYYSDYGWVLTTNKGGYDDMGVGYLVSWLGAVEEELETFSDYSVLSPVLNSTIHVQNLVYLTRSNYTDNNAVKEAIIKYGAVATGIYYSSSFMNSNSYFYTGANGPNHAVTIVGWDDSYSKDKFKKIRVNDTTYISPGGDGAWICKNSWGTTWGNNKGYFYVSYYDKNCVRLGDYDKSTYTIILNDTVRYDKNYQYDIIGITDYLITGESTIWYENIFNATDDEFLAAFSTYFNATSKWTAQIYVNNALKLTQNGISNAGYYTFDLDEFIPLKTGDEFKIVIKLENDNLASFPISEKVRSNRILYSEGVSFFSFDGENWIDLYNYKADMSQYGHTYDSQVACIKAFTINELNTEISLDIPEFVSVDAPLNIAAIVKDEYGNSVNFGNVTFTLDSKDYTVPVINGTATLKIQLTSVKDYPITANYNTNEYYLNSNTSSVINITIKSANLTIDISDIQYGEKFLIKNTLTSDGLNVSAIVKVTINSKTYSVKSNSQSAIDDILNPGDYVATGFYSNIATANTTFNVAKLPLNMDLNISKTDYDSVMISVKLSESINGTVNVTVNSKVYEVNATNGYGALSLSDLDYGKYAVNATFSDAIHEDAYGNANFSIDNIKTNLSADNVEMYYKDGHRFYVTLFDKKSNPIANQKVVIRINGVDNTRVTDGNGSASIAINLIANNYDVFVVYEGDGKYLSSNLSRTVTVKSTVNSNNIVKYYRNDTQFYATILDFKGNTVSNVTVKMNINGVLYYRPTNSEGIVRLNINLAPDTYILTLTNPFTNEMRSYNVTVLSRLVENNNLVKYYKNASKYSVKVLDEKGSPLAGVNVTFNINGVFYQRTTDASGVASLNINLRPGNYIITAQYGFAAVSNTITVLTIIESSDITMNYRDGTTFKARILDDIGNISPGVNVTFNINGVFYQRTTNASGVANLNINLMPGEYIITSMYKGLLVSNTIRIRSI
ncbi:MAG: Ig-like domain repeat protein [Methanobrevibacter sp.]|uniref:C1 family peptidase n=1 Tax=Methanobrevibacter sp. TaxID=66852 RepID=UPI0025D4D209|nr:C1 family peptidase [Methanobrevibacter sp.]MBR0270984.1 Ig-like domain repeat protein [Methanobrevibacter sp.]